MRRIFTLNSLSYSFNCTIGVNNLEQNTDLKSHKYDKDFAH